MAIKRGSSHEDLLEGRTKVLIYLKTFEILSQSSNLKRPAKSRKNYNPVEDSDHDDFSGQDSAEDDERHPPLEQSNSNTGSPQSDARQQSSRLQTVRYLEDSESDEINPSQSSMQALENDSSHERSPSIAVSDMVVFSELFEELSSLRQQVCFMLHPR